MLYCNYNYETALLRPKQKDMIKEIMRIDNLPSTLAHKCVCDVCLRAEEMPYYLNEKCMMEVV
jgi:hypothetical protein